LLSTQKDDHGYTLLNQPVHLGGTLEHIDMSQWHTNYWLRLRLQTPDVPKKSPLSLNHHAGTNPTSLFPHAGKVAFGDRC